jgi:urea transport system permease protein
MRFASLRRTNFVPASLILFAVLLPSPARAQDDAIRQQIAKLADRDAEVRQEAIEALGQTRDQRVAGVLQALNQGNLVVWKKRVLVRQEAKPGPGGKNAVSLLEPLTQEPVLDAAKKPRVVDADDVRELQPTRQERRLLSGVIKFLQDFGSSDPEKRLLAVRRLGDNPDATFLPALEKVAESDADARVRRTARESAALTRIGADIPDQKTEDRLAAIATLANLHSVQGMRVLQQMVQQGQLDAPERRACEEAIRSIQRYQFWVGLGVNLTNGLSAGSVLILMALGLSIIYGQMGVINMAHGELMMLGAYATYEMQRFFQFLLAGGIDQDSTLQRVLAPVFALLHTGLLSFASHTKSDPMNWYFVAAFPFAFCVAAFIGWLIELFVVRHLYGRVLETLLATWGVSLILVQAVRVRYGDNIGVSAPTWLRGGFEVIPYLTVEYARCFILVLCMFCVAFLYALMNFTRIGLKIRATVQGRETAESLGINTRRIDGFAFSLGAGLAGVAGYALTTIAGVTPDMGQNYIVDSFLVVVTGGVGKLAGSVWAGLGLGTLNQLLEPRTFGEALLAAGLIGAVVSWITLTVRAFRQSKRWGWVTLLVPIPLPFAFKFWSQENVGKTFVLYGLAVAALIVGLFRESLFNGLLMQDIQTRWARVFILLTVVIFIQWRPAGLFPPKGRLADV